MMGRLLALALASGLVSAALWHACRPIFSSSVLARRNYRGIDVPVGAGLVAVLSAIVVAAVSTAAASLDVEIYRPSVANLVVLGAVAGFCLLGLIDDLLATGDDRGFRGHLGAMAQGRLTTGGLKLAGGGLVAVVAVGAGGADSFGALLVGSLVVALSANVGNLFDRAPGRTTKVSMVVLVVIVATASSWELPALQVTVVVVAAAVGLLPFDLGEKLMLGDAGANAVGAALGLAIVVTAATSTQVVVMMALMILNLASERWSYSKMIDSFPPLRVLDRLGRRPIEP